MLSTLLVCLPLASLPLAPPPPRLDDALKSRELAGIAEEQALLARQLKRLRQTMEILVLRLQAESRPRAVELLEQGIALLDARERNARALTLEEAMDDARERVESGQVVQSLESQEEVIAGLERLLAVLMERGNLDNIEENLERVREMKAALTELTRRERELRRETRQLRNDSANDAQRELEQGIAEAIREERELLAENERAGRESGSLALEEIEQALSELRSDLEADSGLLEAWRPAESEELAGATEDLENARRAESRARRLSTAAKTLREVSEATTSATAEQADRMEQALEQRLERAERHARASGDEAAETAARALSDALEALRSSRQEGADAGRAAEEVSELASGLEEDADAERATAEVSRERAITELESLTEEDSVAGLVARDVTEALTRASQAESAEESAEATDEAARLLRTGKGDLGRMAEALSSSQTELAGEAERLERGLSALPQGESEAGQRAGEQLEKAAQALRAAAANARREAPQEARQDAERAEQALEAAQEALRTARESTTARDAEERAQRQSELAARTSQLQENAQKGSMDPGSTAEVGEALEAAQRAMERATEELESNRGAAAAEAQREAVEALAKAADSAREGVRPTSPEDRERAAELAEEQARVRDDILRLARRDEEKRNPEAIAGMERAQEAASEAESALDSGELLDAERSEKEVERELDRARGELEKEEEQYESLRQEELLFRITEEIQTAVEAHREQMAGTAEIDAQRDGGDRPSRAQRLRLRRIAREEEAVAERVGEIAGALEDEQSAVFAEVLRHVQTDLEDLAIDLSEEGDYETGERVQGRQRDVEERLEWLLEALQEEQRRREQEQNQDQQQEQDQEQQQETENRLVPNQAELKLLRRMEIEIQDGIERLLVLYPELSEEDPADVNPLILEDVLRLAVRHERTSDLFARFRARLGLPDPENAGGDGETPVEEEEE